MPSDAVTATRARAAILALRRKRGIVTRLTCSTRGLTGVKELRSPPGMSREEALKFPQKMTRFPRCGAGFCAAP